MTAKVKHENGAAANCLQCVHVHVGVRVFRLLLVPDTSVDKSRLVFEFLRSMQGLVAEKNNDWMSE